MSYRSAVPCIWLTAIVKIAMIRRRKRRAYRPSLVPLLLTRLRPPVEGAYSCHKALDPVLIAVALQHRLLFASGSPRRIPRLEILPRIERSITQCMAQRLDSGCCVRRWQGRLFAENGV
jgi:hypothetical protein